MRTLRTCYWLGLGLIAAGLLWSTAARVSDEADFVARVRAPRYRHENWRRRPLVFIDEAHGNSHTIETRFRALAELARADGYTVRPNRRRFQRDVLRGVNLLVVAGGQMDEAEIRAVREWVSGGGGLLVAGSPDLARGLDVSGEMLLESGRGRVASFAQPVRFTARELREKTGDQQRQALEVLHWLTQR